MHSPNRISRQANKVGHTKTAGAVSGHQDELTSTHFERRTETFVSAKAKAIITISRGDTAWPDWES